MGALMTTVVEATLTTSVVCPDCGETEEFEGNADGLVYNCFKCDELIEVVT